MLGQSTVPIEWRPIAGLDGRYEISNHGDVRNIRTGKVLRPGRISSGYYSVALPGAILPRSKDGRRRFKTCLIHRLVLDAFRGPMPELDGNHIDGDKSNNHVGNLEWVTRSRNIYHALETGLSTRAKGERAPTSKLTEDQVRAIRVDSRPIRAIAKDYGIASNNVLAVRNRTTWRHVE